MNNRSLKLSLLAALLMMAPLQAAEVLDWQKFNAKVEESIPRTYAPEPHKQVVAKQLDAQLDALSQPDKQQILQDISKQPLHTQEFLVRYFHDRKATYALPTMLKLYDTTKDQFGFFQVSVMETVADLGGISQRAFLISGLRRPNVYIRKAAADALAKLPYDRETVLRLVEALEHEADSTAEVSFITALGKFSKQDDYARSELEKRLVREKDVTRVLNEVLGAQHR